MPRDLAQRRLVSIAKAASLVLEQNRIHITGTYWGLKGLAPWYWLIVVIGHHLLIVSSLRTDAWRGLCSVR